MGRLLLLLAALAALGGPVRAAEALPPPPARYCNDAAGLLSPAARERIDLRLEQFERETSNQIVVAIYPKLPVDLPVEDYTIRVARSWQVGQKGRNNGAVLFVFVAERQVRIEVGYGLEGAIPDAIAKRIVSDVIAPRFHAGDYDGGVAAGVGALMAAAQGEYRGGGQTAAEQRGEQENNVFLWVVLAVILGAAFLAANSRHGGSSFYTPRGRNTGGSWGWGGPGWGGGWGGGGGGGGGFSGGGGSFGGGGAGGSW